MIHTIENKANIHLKTILYAALMVCLANTHVLAQPSPTAQMLEKRIYTLNNSGQYTEARNIIQTFLESKSINNEDRYYAHLYMSYIYKRLFDYDSNLRYLDLALTFGMRTSRPEFFIAQTKSQKALAFFDTGRYKEAAALMAELAATNYAHLDDEYKAKIIMQEAFLAYLKEDYNTSKRKYDQSLALLLKASPCDAPMIYAKQIKLSIAMNDAEAVRKAYTLAIKAADSCGIDKYGIYVREQLLDGLAKNHGYSNITNQLDSLNQKYNKEQHLRDIQAIEEASKLQLKDVIIQTQERQTLILGTSAVLMFIALLALGYFYLALKRQKDLIEQQSDINEQTVSILSHDIKEPLLGVRLLLKKLKIDDPYLAQASQSLEKQIGAVNGILHNLLKLRRLTFQNSSQQDICSVSEAVRTVVGELALMIHEKDIKMVVDIQADQKLPISREKLQIIVHNLLNNAIKYSYAHTAIHIFSTEKGICIKDYGVGMNATDKSALLATVSTSKEGTKHEKGLGLGLYLVGRMIQESRLTIHFDAVEPSGTAVYVQMP